MQFDYFYNKESNLFTFLQVPKYLITDDRFKPLSAESKLLYALFLDRVHLSAANNWTDDCKRIYIIYTLEDIMNDIGYKHDKCTKLLKELEGIGLIERKRQGLGKPDKIYVKNFVKDLDSSVDEVLPADQAPVSQDTANKNAEIPHSGVRENSSLECDNIAPNNTYKNKPDSIITTPSKKHIVDEDLIVLFHDIGITNDKDVKSIFDASQQDKEKCKSAINALRQQSGPIRNLVGWLIKAVKDGYNLLPYNHVDLSRNGNNNWFKMMQSDYDFDELERRLVKN